MRRFLALVVLAGGTCVPALAQSPASGIEAAVSGRVLSSLREERLAAEKLKAEQDAKRKHTQEAQRKEDLKAQQEAARKLEEQRKALYDEFLISVPRFGHVIMRRNYSRWIPLFKNILCNFLDSRLVFDHKIHVKRGK